MNARSVRVDEYPALEARIVALEIDRAADRARLDALERQGDRFWAILLEISGRLPPSESEKLPADLIPIKAASRSGFSESGLRRMIRTGRVAAKKIGGRVFVAELSLPSPRK